MIEKRWCWTLPAYLALLLVIVIGLRGELGPSSKAQTSTPSRSQSHLSALIDLSNFTYIHTAVCNSTSPLYVTLVSSAPWNLYNREEIRRTWGGSGELVFLVGLTNSTWQSVLDREAEDYGDIVQGSFIDSYRNLTYKHVMGLIWAQKNCGGSRYILKVDDDVFVNTPFLVKYLPTLTSSRLILCPVQETSLVKRSYRSKWRVSPSEYPHRWYPRYCSGWVILYSSDVTHTLSSIAQVEPYFWIDDVHLTGTLAIKANYSRTDLQKLGVGEEEVLDLIFSGKERTDFMFALTKPQYFQTLWDLVNKVTEEETFV